MAGKKIVLVFTKALANTAEQIGNKL